MSALWGFPNQTAGQAAAETRIPALDAAPGRRPVTRPGTGHCSDAQPIQPSQPVPGPEALSPS